MKTVIGLYCLTTILASSYAWIEYGLSNALLTATFAAGVACWGAIIEYSGDA